MATHDVPPLALIREALNAWPNWRTGAPTENERPEVGEVLGVGSANTVFSLDRDPNFVLRARHNARSMSLNPPDRELAIWRQAARLNLAPPVVWAGKNSDVVVTSRLHFDLVDDKDHSELLMRIHESELEAPRLSLAQTAERYTTAITSKGITHLAIDCNAQAIREDLHRLDNEPPCFCHNDLTSSNNGRLENRYFAIDWEYAARGSRHFDIAVASQNMERAARDHFAERTAGASFDRPTWQAACRVERLMYHLWTLAVLGSAEIGQSKEIVAKRWRPHE